MEAKAEDGRQPVGTLYGGAHLYAAGTIAKLASIASRIFEQYMPDPAALAALFHIDDMKLAQDVHTCISAKLAREPVEDFRIDFEDGYGWRADDVEDADAEKTAHAFAEALQADRLPPFFGIRIKPFTEASQNRALRTLRQFLTALGRVRLPQSFVITLPKVSSPDQVERLCSALDGLENELSLPPISIELMVEEPRVFFDHSGKSMLRRLVDASGSRCRGMHLGAYDLMSACGIVASEQRLDHSACDFARQLMLFSLAEADVWLADGATVVLPVPPHKEGSGKHLSDAQLAENRQAVIDGLRLHYNNVYRALVQGIYQGWDLHPAQLPARYAAVYTFFLRSLPAMRARLKAFEAAAAQASLVGATFDDAATGRGLRAFFARARSCGALSTSG